MDRYQVIEEIGKGSYGSVFKIKSICEEPNEKQGKLYCWKEINYGHLSEKERAQIVSEINCLSKLNHTNIVKYVEKIVHRDQKKIFIIMEYCENGDMAQLIKKCKAEKDFVAEDVIWKIFMQILLALRECHSRAIPGSKILHRDLKPSNVFFDSNNNVKLGDFGLSRIIQQDGKDPKDGFASTNVGTPYYMSPEQINEKTYDEKTDLWSLGCVIYELVSLLPPFTAGNHLALAQKIIAGKIDRIPQRYSEDLQEVIQWMLNTVPDQRPSVEDLIKLPKIKLRINERKMRDQYAKLKYKESKLEKKASELNQKEMQVKAKEEAMSQKHQRVKDLYSKQVLQLKQMKIMQQSMQQNNPNHINFHQMNNNYQIHKSQVQNQMNNLLLESTNNFQKNPQLVSGHMQQDRLDGFEMGCKQNESSSFLIVSGNDEKSNNNLTNSKNSNDISSVIQSVRANPLMNNSLSSNFLAAPKEDMKPIDILKSHESLRDQIRKMKQNISQQSSNNQCDSSQLSMSSLYKFKQNHQQISKGHLENKQSGCINQQNTSIKSTHDKQFF